MGHISPRSPVRFSGMYKFVPPAGKEESFPVMLTAPVVKEYLSQEMYERDRKKDELKESDPLRSAFFTIKGMVFGFTGDDMHAISAKIHEKIGNPIGATMTEIRSKLAAQRGKDFYKQIENVPPKIFEEAFDEYIQSKGKSVEDIEEIKFS